MRLKPIVLTVAVLAVLSAVAYYLQRPAPPPSADARLGQSLADRATIEKAQKLRLSDQGKTVTLARQTDGTWRVTSYFDFPADFQKLTRFVSDLSDAKLDRLVTSNPERMARLEFKDTKIELLDGADKAVWAVTLGKSADTGGRFVRFDDEQKAYLANFSAWMDSDSKNWADSQLLNLKPEDIAKIELSFPPVAAASVSEPPAPSTITFSRAKKEDPWTADKTPPNQKVRADKVSSLLSSLDTVRFTDTTELNDPKLAEAKPHERTAKLTTFDGKTYTFAFYRKPEEKKLKPPTPSADGKSGPAALGAISDLPKKPDVSASSKPGTSEPSVGAKPLAPEFETIPAGPVFVAISSSDAAAPINALMQKRAFEISDYVFTGLPQQSADLFESAPASGPVASPRPAGASGPLPLPTKSAAAKPAGPGPLPKN